MALSKALAEWLAWFAKTPVEVRFFVPLAFLFLCFGLSARGGMYIYDDRRWRGALWLCGGLVPAGIALWLGQNS